MILSKWLDTALVDNTEWLAIINEFKEKEKHLAKEINENKNGSNTQGTELGGKENNKLEGNEGVMDMWDEFIIKKRCQDIV